MRFIEVGLRVLQLRFFSGMDAMSVIYDSAVGGFSLIPAPVRVNADPRWTAGTHPGGVRQHSIRGLSARHPCDRARLFFHNFWPK